MSEKKSSYVWSGKSCSRQQGRTGTKIITQNHLVLAGKSWLCSDQSSRNNFKRYHLKPHVKHGKNSNRALFAWWVHLLNDTHRERLVFHSVQYRNGWLAASDLFHMFTQSIKFYTFHYQYRCLRKCDSSNRQ